MLLGYPRWARVVCRRLLAHSFRADARWFPSALAPVLTGFLLIRFAASAALADDMIGLSPAALNAMGHAMTFAFVAFLASYSPVIWVVEAAVLQRLIPLPFRQWLLYSAIANIVSSAISLLWYFGLDHSEQGWKTSLLAKSPFLILFVRSFLVTVAEETVVVALFLGTRATFRRGLGAVVAANGVTYAIGLVILLLIR